MDPDHPLAALVRKAQADSPAPAPPSAEGAAAPPSQVEYPADCEYLSAPPPSAPLRGWAEPQGIPRAGAGCAEGWGRCLTLLFSCPTPEAASFCSSPPQHPLWCREDEEEGGRGRWTLPLFRGLPSSLAGDSLSPMNWDGVAWPFVCSGGWELSSPLDGRWPQRTAPPPLAHKLLRAWRMGAALGRSCVSPLPLVKPSGEAAQAPQSYSQLPWGWPPSLPAVT